MINRVSINMKYCSNCKKAPTFTAVLTALNPARIKCTHCKQKIIIKTLPAVMATTVALVASLAAIALIDHLEYGPSGMIAALLTVGLLLEIGYFWGIRDGCIASNLVDN